MKSNSSHSTSATVIEKWLSPRRKRFWVIVLILLYALSGFFLTPVLIKNAVVNAAREQLGREASIGHVTVNPFVLSLTVTDFELADPDGSRHAGFDELFINFQLSSAFNWAWTLREIRLEGMHLNYERFAVGDSSLSRLLEDMANHTEAEPAVTASDGGLPRLLIHKLEINGGRGRFVDRVPASPVDLEIGPIDVSISELNSLPDRYGRQTVHVSLGPDARLSWSGSISLAPLESEGELSIENSRLDKSIAYLKSLMPLDSVEALLSVQTRYKISETPDGGIVIELDGIEGGLSDVVITGLTPVAEILKFDSVTLQGGSLHYPESELNIALVQMNEPELNAWLDENAELSLMKLIADGNNGSPVNSDESGDASTWQLGIEEFVLANGQLKFSDQSIQPPGHVEVRDVHLTVNGISNIEDRVIPVNLSMNLAAGGSFGFNGEATALPAISIDGTATATEVPLALAQPWLQQHLNVLIENGYLSSETEISLKTDEAVTASGSINVNTMQVKDTVENEPLLAWEQLTIDRFELDTQKHDLGLSTVIIKAPYGRFEVNEDLSTNLSGLLVQSESDSDATSAENPAWSATVGAIEVSDGSMDFSDLSLPLPFATHIVDLDGTISIIDTASTEPSNIRLEGQVDEYGLARIEGAMNMVDPVGFTNVSVEFQNLAMSNLSPYTAQFAGREIDEGKLDLDLFYSIDQGQLDGQNAIVMSDLKLGAEVESPDAVSLPLGLAIALLTDSNGVIDIELPVEGDINDPEFRIGGVIWKAIAGLVTKVVSAPFKLLGELVGVENEDLGQIRFLAGRFDLTPPEVEKIDQLKLALQERPDLSIEISGVYDPVTDVPVLKYFHLRDRARELVGRDAALKDNEIAMMDDEIRSILLTLFSERFPDIPPESIAAAYTAPPPDDPEGEPVLDELAYAVDLRDRLLAAEQISEQDLLELATARADAIRSAFISGGEFDESRIQLIEPRTVESDDGEWVLLALGVASP